MMIERIDIENFTAFKELALEFSPGVNLFIGANGTGKTHLLKLLYTALSAQRESRKKVAFEQELTEVFLPYQNHIGRLVNRGQDNAACKVHIIRDNNSLSFEFTRHALEHMEQYQTWWPDNVGSAVYIPVKEMLADAPGFRSLYEQRVIHIEKVYFDIVSKAFLPILRGPISKEHQPLLRIIESLMDGKIKQENEHFFLKNPSGNLEFTLLAEGIRKFGLLWLLIQNGTLLEDATLFWDEPEANLNPSMIKPLVQVLLHLQQQGIQVFIATHSYIVLKEFDLQRTQENSVRYFSLQRAETGDITCISGAGYNDIVPNKIAAAYTAIYDEEVQRSLRL